MSAQPIETEPVDTPPGPDLTVPPDLVEVRRNPAVSLAIGSGAAALAIAYLWRASATAAALDWLLCAALAVLAVVFLRGLFDARAPLLVVDEMGVRIRLATQWRGLPWEAIDQVVVRPRRGWLRDGQVVVHLHHLPRAIEGLEGRAARHAQLNQRWYGGALAVPLSLTTRVTGASEAELADQLALLGRGRAEVVSLVPSAEPAEEAPAPADSEVSEAAGLPVADLEPEVAGLPEAGGRRTALVGWVRRVLPRRSRVAHDDIDEADDADGTDDRADDGADDGVDLGVQDGQSAAHTSDLDGPGAAPLDRDEIDDVDGLDHLGDAEESVVRVLGDDVERAAALTTRSPSAAQTLRVLEDHDAGEQQRPSGVRPLARLNHPVAPLVIDDFEPEPAYDPVIGPELAASRTRVGLSVDELAERTRIRPHVIESIEVDDFTPCGGDFYARGHIRTLARVLGKDPVPLLDHFERRYASAPVNARRVFEAELATGLTGSMRRTTGGSNWALLVGVVLALVLVWSAVRLFAGSDQEMLENPPPMLNGSAGLGNSLDEAQAAAPPARIAMTVAAVEAGTRVEVRDGAEELVFDGDLVLGEVKRLQVQPPVTVTADDAGAVTVSIAGRDRGFVGELGQDGTRVFRRG